MLLGEILQKTTQFFRDKKIDSARLDAELLIADALKLKRIDLYIKFEYPLTEGEIQICRDFVRRRAQLEPVAYILGKKDFYNESFIVKSGVLIPRPETEGIVEEVLRWQKERNLSEPAIVDLGSGSGCIGLSVLKELSGKGSLLGLDTSAIAVEVANENATRLKLTNCEFKNLRVQEHNFEDHKFDIVVANPPYIAKNDPDVQPSVKSFEPHTALFAEDEGYQEISEWAIVTAGILKPGGLAAFEIGATQAEKTKKIFSDTGQFALIRSAKDLAGLDRYIFAEKS